MRRMRSRAGFLVGFALSIPAIAAANEPPEKPAEDASETELDAELLEFLGSVDDLGVGWTEYLTQTDIAGVAKGEQTSAPKDETDD
jgi:hypothetical protein